MLVILDGWGHNPDPDASAITAAHTPYVDNLYKEHPSAELVTYGEAVGLPEGQMGNSEVGHLNIGAGRVVHQELAKINKAVADGSLSSHPEIQKIIALAKERKKPIHLMGLASDGGVHAHVEHILALAQSFSEAGVKVYYHLFMDGRDTGPNSGMGYVRQIIDADIPQARISSIIGRYYAMDRDNRWERIKAAYDLLVQGEGSLHTDPLQAIQAQYDQDTSDEFILPIKLGDKGEGNIGQGDLVCFANFRTDRPRQITTVLTQKDMTEHGMTKVEGLHFLTMTEYDADYQGVNVIYRKEKLEHTLGEIISAAGRTQLRVAETEKYPHVTFFFSGGREVPFEGESRILIDSPKVATYDLQPEMSAYEVTSRVDDAINEEAPDFIVINYANADMVGHTGDFHAAVKAVETLDACLEALLPRALRAGYEILIIADHGNSDVMVNEDGSAHTAHTTNPVPVIYLGEMAAGLKDGALADLAPTLLGMMDLEVHPFMTGQNLLEYN